MSNNSKITTSTTHPASTIYAFFNWITSYYTYLDFAYIHPFEYAKSGIYKVKLKIYGILIRFAKCKSTLIYARKVYIFELFTLGIFDS